MSAFNEKLARFEDAIKSVIQEYSSTLTAREAWIVMFDTTNAIQAQANKELALEMIQNLEEQK